MTASQALAQVARSGKNQLARIHAIWGLGQVARTSAPAVARASGAHSSPCSLMPTPRFAPRQPKCWGKPKSRKRLPA